MVFSELAAATLIAVCGLKNSYRIILRGERLIRRRIRRPAPAIDGYETFPRFFIRRIFRAGLVIAMRWEGRAKNAAQLAADARLRARSASDAVATRAAEVRRRASDARAVAEEHAAAVRDRAAAARTRAVQAKDRVVQLKKSVERRITANKHEGSANGGQRKFSTIRGLAQLGKQSTAALVRTRFSSLA